MLGIIIETKNLHIWVLGHCVCTQVYIYTCIYIYTLNTYIYVSTYTYLHTHISRCIRIHTYSYECDAKVYVHTCILVYLSICLSIFLYMYIYAYIYIYICNSIGPIWAASLPARRRGAVGPVARLGGPPGHSSCIGATVPKGPYTAYLRNL